MHKKILFDCDNTMGLQGCDVDDGLALLYLLGQNDMDICGITTTYGNSELDSVHSCTEILLKEINRRDIELVRGCPDRATLKSEAAEFIVKTVHENAGNLSILATGSLTNLYAAYLIDNSIFQEVKEVIIMGGITEELIINGKVLDELNFSCDPVAAECVLSSGRNVSVITGNNCLDAFFTQEEFEERLYRSDKPRAKYITQKCMYWFEDMMSRFSIGGFHNWDVVAASFLVKPSLFENCLSTVKLDQASLNNGFLKITTPANADCIINIPKIKDIKPFTQDVYQAWLD